MRTSIQNNQYNYNYLWDKLKKVLLIQGLKILLKVTQLSNMLIDYNNPQGKLDI